MCRCMTSELIRILFGFFRCFAVPLKLIYPSIDGLKFAGINNSSRNELRCKTKT